jgi:hypothetical protein
MIKHARMTRIAKWTGPFILLCIILISSACVRNSDKDKKEISVINDVFKELTDSIIHLPMYPLQPFPFPPLQVLSKAKGRIPGYPETAEHYKKEWEDYKKLLKAIDTNQNVISVSDSLLSTDINMTFVVAHYRKDTSCHNYFEAFDSFVAKKKQSQYLDIKELKYKGKFEFVTRSSITNESGNRQTVFPYYYYGNLTLTRVYFDKNDHYAFFECDLNCGHYSHDFFLVLLKHNKSGWIIDRLLLAG